MSIAGDVETNIAKFNAAHDRAIEKWDSMAVRLNAYVGGQDPSQVTHAVEEIYTRADRWKARGAGLAAGFPLQVGNPPKPDTYAKWIELGNELIHELQTTAEDATNDSLVTAVVETTTVTKDTIVGSVVDGVQTLNNIGRWISSHKTLLMVIAIPLVALWLLAQVGILGWLTRRKS